MACMHAEYGAHVGCGSGSYSGGGGAVLYNVYVVIGGGTYMHL